MDSTLRADTLTSEALSAVSWASIAAGAVSAAALTLALLAFGAGLGLSSISPWSDSGVSAPTFKAAAGIYLVIVAVMSSAIGGTWPPGYVQNGPAYTRTKCFSATPRMDLSRGRLRPC